MKKRITLTLLVGVIGLSVTNCGPKLPKGQKVVELPCFAKVFELKNFQYKSYFC